MDLGVELGSWRWPPYFSSGSNIAASLIPAACNCPAAVGSILAS
jgi:hypothetical protein